jgi:hypothetical protein
MTNMIQVCSNLVAPCRTNGAEAAIQIATGSVFMINPRAQWKLLQTWIIFVTARQHLVHISRKDGPRSMYHEYFSIRSEPPLWYLKGKTWVMVKLHQGWDSKNSPEHDETPHWTKNQNLRKINREFRLNFIRTSISVKNTGSMEIKTRAQWKQHTWLLSVMVKQHLVQIGQTDGPTEYLS